MLLTAGKEDLSKPLLAAAAEVGQMGVGFDRSRDNLEVADAAELIATGAEDKGLDGSVRLCLGRRHELRDRRHERAHAEKLGRRATDYGCGVRVVRIAATAP